MAQVSDKQAFRSLLMQEQSQLELIKTSITKENEVIARRNIAIEVEI